MFFDLSRANNKRGRLMSPVFAFYAGLKRAKKNQLRLRPPYIPKFKSFA